MMIEPGALLDPASWRGSRWIGHAGNCRETLSVREPASGTVLGEIGRATPLDVAEAAARASKAQPGWAALGGGQRAAILRRAADCLAANEAEYSLWLARESGSARVKVGIELAAGIGILHKAAAMLSEPQGLVLPQLPGRTSLGRRVPHGIVGVISPFNFPLILGIRAVAPALAAGNAVLLKPDPRTPFSGGALMARVLELAGLPEGLLQVLPGHGDVGAAMCEDARIAMISFTGSTAAGRRVGEACGRMLKKVQLELGGKNPLIVLEDAELDLAVESALWGAFLHQGQICMATGRILVARSVLAPFTERLLEKAGKLKAGDPVDPDVVIGPLIDAGQRDRVHALVQRSVQEGARLLLGGSHDGLIYAPTILADVRPGMAVFEEEVFGPVAAITGFDTDDEAVALASTNEYGLSAGIISRDLGRATGLGDRLDVGMLHINDQTVADEPGIPFGGRRNSGNGESIGGPANWDAFSSWQWMTLRERPTPHHL